MNERLHELGHILMGAGSDNGTITMSIPDAKLLEVADLAGSKQTFKGKDKKYVWNETTKEYDLKEIEIETLGVEADVHTGTGKTLAYIVCIGLARKALKKLLNGQPVEGCRQPDIQAPTPEPEEEPEPIAEFHPLNCDCTECWLSRGVFR